MGKKPWLDSDGILAAIKRKVAIPDSQELLTDEEILAFVNEEMSVSMVPSILSYHEEFFVTRLLEGGADSVELEANLSRYPIPSRAIGSRLRDLFYQDTNGDLREMVRVNPDDKAFYNNASAQSSNALSKFYLEGNDLILVPAVNASPTGSLVFTYFLRTNQLVDVDRAATISSIGTVTSTVTLTCEAAIPSHIVAGELIDFIQTDSGHQCIGLSIPVVSVSSNQITIAAADLPSTLAVGDYLCIEHECIIPQIPSDLHIDLVERASARIMAAIGDTAGLQTAMAKVAENQAKQGILIDNRVEGSPQKVVSRGGFLRNNKRRY
jgi:hypothetical protein